MNVIDALEEAKQTLGDSLAWFKARKFRGVADWIAEGGLRLREFTALFGVVGSPDEVKRLLAEQDEAASSPYAGALGVHSLRWFLFSPGQKNPPAGSAPAVPAPGDFTTQALVLSLVFDGDVEDTLRGLCDQASAEIGAILRHVDGFTAGADIVKFLLKRRVRTGFLFRDLGPLKPSSDFANAYTPDATRAEIEDAQELEQVFEEFYAENLGLDPAVVRRKFLAQFGGGAFRFPPTPVERRFCDEERWVRRAQEIVRRLQAQAARADAGKRKRRAFHAKAHGLISAKFTVKAGIDPEYQVGLFHQVASYDAHLRPSNGTHLMGRDSAGDARGLAISVHLPQGSTPAHFAADDFLERPDAEANGRQDFILMSHPVFFVPDIRRATVFLSILTATPWYTQLVRALAYAAGSGTFRQLGIAARTLARKLVHPLAAEFHSATSYRFGQDYVVKYSVELEDRTRFDRLRIGPGRNFLSAALKESLKADPIRLRFFLHVLPSCGTVEGGRSIQDVVEDATLDWAALGAKKVEVATIEIGAQDPTTEVDLAGAEAWTFNPWHALSDHRPIGSLNRARFLIYRASQRGRNSVASEAPGDRPTTPPRSFRQAAE